MTLVADHFFFNHTIFFPMKNLKLQINIRAIIQTNYLIKGNNLFKIILNFHSNHKARVGLKKKMNCLYFKIAW